MPDEGRGPGAFDAERVPVAQVLRVICGAAAGGPSLLTGPLLVYHGQGKTAGEPLGNRDPAALAGLLR
eukprot:4483992-Alexandrium_andersonii.AAC.1